MVKPCCTVAVIFQYKTVNGEKRTDKGGKATLFKKDDRLFLLTVKQIATYADLGPNDTLVSISIPLLRPVRGDKQLAYRNLMKETDIPVWTEVDVSEEEPLIPIDEDQGKSINLRAHDSVYYLEVTKEAWANSPLYKPLTETTVNVCVGDQVSFCTQRRMGTGFLAEYPQWRGIRELEGNGTVYPGQGNEWYQLNSPYQVPPTNTKDCKAAQVSFAFPSSILTDWCYYPPMFLVDVNVKVSSTGSPVINEENELIGLVSDPGYLISGSKDLCFPGTWICAIPADITFKANESAEGEGKDEEKAEEKPKQPKMQPAKKKAKKKSKVKKHR